MSVNTASNKIGELRCLCPLPGGAEQVAVSQDKATWNCLKCIHCSICICNGLQAMRPVHGRRDSCIDGLNGGKEIPGKDVLGPEDLAPVQIIELEIVCERPVSPKSAQGRLPHMAVCVNHTRHENTIACIDLYCIIRSSELVPDSCNAIGDNEDIAALDH